MWIQSDLERVRADIEEEAYEEVIREHRLNRERLLMRLAKEDRNLYRIARARDLRTERFAITRIQLASQLGVSRSTLYERLARIEKELQPRYCACGCGWQLPRKSSRRRRYVSDAHGADYRRRRAQAIPPASN